VEDMSVYLVYLGNQFETHHQDYYIVTVKVSFIPKETIGCNPPYLAAVRDSCWIKYRVDRNGSHKPNPSIKSECERALGMTLLPIES
jgi:hypothetical protein